MSAFSAASPEPYADTPPRMTPAVAWLAGACAALYFLQLTVLDPVDVQGALGLRAGDLTGGRWWTPVSYAFAHGGFWHLALNLYTLALFGPRVEWAWGTGPFVRFYVACALGGAALHLAADGGATLIGASAAILGVLLAYATLWPDQPLYLFGVVPMTVKWLVALIAVVNLLGGMGAAGGSDVAYLAHLGGLGAGWVMLRLSRRLDLTRLKERIAPVPDVDDDALPPRAVPRARGPRRRLEDDEVGEGAPGASAAVVTPPRPRPARETPGAAKATALDAVLDKISASGLESLTADERRLLDDASRRLRDDR